MASTNPINYGVLVPIPSGINPGLTAASQSAMLAVSNELLHDWKANGTIP